MGYFYALLAAVLFGVNGSVTRIVVDSGLDPAQLTLFRVASTAVIAGIYLLIANRRAFRVTPRQLLALVLLGIFGIAMLQWTYAMAIQRLPVGITLLLEYTAVLIVAVIAWAFFKEQVKARLWVAIACVLGGLVVVAQLWTAELDPVGVLFGLGAAASLSIYFLGGEREVGKSSAMAVAFWAMSSATVFWLLFSGWWNLDPALFTDAVSLQGNLAHVELPLWIPLAWNMLLGSFAPFFFSLLALRYLTATAAGVVATAEIIFAFIFAWLWLGEGLAGVQILGAAVVLIGIVLAQTARKDKVVDADLALSDSETRAIA
ncbi:MULTISPECIES: DMT family transporter [unclassified Salinibacterium]|uniref:EamA family transporter n=1 Tax=unclassified Salinibacterium TaxID=2632331 RepID=UPI00143E0E87|nr:MULTISPECIES: DMT family transporter [unclassified Salinibacterium]